MTPLRILLIDDSEDDRLLLARLLSRLDEPGAVLVCAASYEEGVEALVSQAYDVCLVDYHLGPRSGLQLLREARGRGSTVPTILMTGQIDRSVDLAATEAGAADFVDKRRLDGAQLERSLRYAISQGRAQAALRQSEAGFRALIEALPVAVTVHDHGHLLYANAAAAGQMGVASADEVVGRHFTEVVTPLPAAAHDELPPGAPRRQRNRRRDGSEYIVEHTTLDMVFAGRPVQLTIAHDVTERLRHQEETDRLMRQLAETNAKLLAESTTDELTTLWNYRRLLEIVTDEMRRARRTRHPASLLMIDIDRFKKFNDRCGHEAGNVVLRGVALLLRKNLREVDALARYGGEELCALLPATRALEAAVVADRLRLAIASEPFPGAEQQPGGHLSVSIGVAELSPSDRTPADLIRRADQALYRAKRKGRDRVEVASTR